MSDIALINGDIQVSHINDLATVNDDNDIIQSAINNIMTIKGENPFHEEIGNMIFNGRNKISTTSANLIATLCKNAIHNDPRVKQVVEITATKSKTIYGQCSISFILETQDGKQLHSNAIINII